MLVLAAVLIVVAIGVWLFGLFEVLHTDEGKIRHLPRFAWFLIVLLGFQLGAVAWLLFGRRRGIVTVGLPWSPRSRTARDHAAGDARPYRCGPLGPDDDPEFLRRLDRHIHGDE